MNAKIFILLFIAAVFLFAGCGGPDRLEKEQTILGLNVVIELNPDKNKQDVDKFFDQAFNIFEEYYTLLQGSGGVIAQLNSSPSPVKVDDGVRLLLTELQKKKQLSDGYLNLFTGGLDELCEFDAPAPVYPEFNLLFEAMRKARETKLIHTGNNQFHIDGGGKLDIKHISIGWAMDRTAQKMEAAGVYNGKITAGNIHRFWGVSPKKTGWEFTVNSPLGDSLNYRITPPSGALATINIYEDGFKINDVYYHKHFDVDSGKPLTEPYSVTVWSERAQEAAALAEAALCMGRSKAIELIPNRWNAGILIVRPDDLGFVAETGRKMSPWVSQEYNTEANILK